MGETYISYGPKLLELTGEAMKAKSGDEVVDLLVKCVKGLFQDAGTVEECIFALVMAVSRKTILSGGRTFMENQELEGVEGRIV